MSEKDEQFLQWATEVVEEEDQGFSEEDKKELAQSLSTETEGHMPSISFDDAEACKRYMRGKLTEWSTNIEGPLREAWQRTFAGSKHPGINRTKTVPMIRGAKKGGTAWGTKKALENKHRLAALFTSNSKGYTRFANPSMNSG